MIYRNSIKIMMTNFWLVSRILVFMIFHFAIVFGISYMFFLPILNLLISNNFFINIQNVYETFFQNLNLQDLFSNIGFLFDEFIQIITTNFSSIGFNVIATIFTLVFLGLLFKGMYNVVITNVLYYSMSNNVKLKFTPSLISTLNTNLKFSLTSFFVKTPLSVILFIIVLYSFKLLTVGGLVSFFAPLLIVLIYLVLTSLKQTIFYGWAPSIIVFEKGNFHALDKSLKITLRKLKKVFANAFYIVLTLFVINVFSAIVTFGASLIITIPMSVLLFSCFSMVMFYSNYGMRYYVDEFNVIVPVKMEKTEPFSSLKYLV